MKAWVQELMKERSELQIAPLIDVVFLLLIYFMVSAQLKRPEAALGLSLPGEVSVSTQMVLPDEQIIEVNAAGHIILNNQVFSDPEKEDLLRLQQILVRYKESAASMRQPAAIVIAAHDDAFHERVIDVLNLCAAAEIKQISFGSLTP